MRCHLVYPGCFLHLDKKWHCIDPEAGQPLLHPEPHDFFHLVCYGQIGSVQVRLKRIEMMKIVLPDSLVIGPVASLLARED
jgi:hypothetical protein